MDSPTDRLDKLRQKQAEEKAQYNNDVRAHVVKIASQLGLCLRVLGTDNEQVTKGYWQTLGHNICDFTEFLDAN